MHRNRPFHTSSAPFPIAALSLLFLNWMQCSGRIDPQMLWYSQHFYFNQCNVTSFIGLPDQASNSFYYRCDVTASFLDRCPSQEMRIVLNAQSHALQTIVLSITQHNGIPLESSIVPAQVHAHNWQNQNARRSVSYGQPRPSVASTTISLDLIDFDSAIAPQCTSPVCSLRFPRTLPRSWPLTMVVRRARYSHYLSL